MFLLESCTELQKKAHIRVKEIANYINVAVYLQCTFTGMSGVCKLYNVGTCKEGSFLNHFYALFETQKERGNEKK